MDGAAVPNLSAFALAMRASVLFVTGATVEPSVSIMDTELDVFSFLRTVASHAPDDSGAVCWDLVQFTIISWSEGVSVGLGSLGGMLSPVDRGGIANFGVPEPVLYFFSVLSLLFS